MSEERADEAPERPSLDSVQKFGPLANLLRKARRARAVEQARQEEAEAQKQAPAEGTKRLHEKHVNSPEARSCSPSSAIAERLSRADLEAELGWPQRTVSTDLQLVGRSRPVEKLGDNDRRARYRLAS